MAKSLKYDGKSISIDWVVSHTESEFLVDPQAQQLYPKLTGNVQRSALSVLYKHFQAAWEAMNNLNTSKFGGPEDYEPPINVEAPKEK
jgi:hypothetical protein